MLTPREAMFSILQHRTVRPVPYQLSMEDEVAQRLDAYYGDARWRERLTPYLVGVGAVDTDMKTPLDAVHTLDAYGGVWRSDKRPWHLEQVPLPEPEWGDYLFPAAEKFFRPAWKEQAYTTSPPLPMRFISAIWAGDYSSAVGICAGLKMP